MDLQVSSSGVDQKEESLEGSSVGAGVAEIVEPVEPADDGGNAADEGQHLVKLSYHDSGIDIRDPMLHITPNATKKVKVRVIVVSLTMITNLNVRINICM